jgi:hypothetical protein
MSQVIEDAIVALLVADTNMSDTGANDILTGGIYAYKRLGKKGLDPSNSYTASAYTLVNGFNILQPCCVVKVRSQVVDGTRYDRATKVSGLRGVLEFWLYDESIYTTIETARNAIYALLQSSTNVNIGLLELANYLDGLRDESLNDAALLRDDYTFVKTKR